MNHLHQVKSSTIDSIGYDPATRELTVHFKTGGSWLYQGVSPSQHTALVVTPSPGRFLRENIKGKCEGRKL